MAEIIKLSEPEPVSGVSREKAIKHILNVLEYDNFICQCIRLHVNFETGNVICAPPAGINIKDIAEFSQGLGEWNSSLATRILNILRTHPGAIAIFDDVMAEPGDEYLQNFYFAKDKEVYRWVSASEATEVILAKLILETAVSWHFLCIILVPDKDINVKDCIIRSQCNNIINWVIEIIVGAFDGEGYVHWIPNSPRRSD